MRERLYVVRFYAIEYGGLVCYNKGRHTTWQTTLEEATRYTKPELDAAWNGPDTYCNDAWRREIVVLNEWR